MSTMPEDLRTLVLGTTTVSGLVGTRCHYNKDAPQQSSKPYVWYRVTTDNEELTMDGVGGIHESFVDLECVDDDEAGAQAIADAIKGRLHGFKGTMGNVTAKGIFVRDKDDDYAPFANDSDEGAHVVAYSVNVWYST